MRNINSLKNTIQFKEVYENGTSVANKLMVLYVYEKEGPLQFGISVSKKVGNSVIRHRTARLLRVSFVSLKNQLPQNLKLVVIARAGIIGKKQQEVQEAFESLCRKKKLV